MLSKGRRLVTSITRKPLLEATKKERLLPRCLTPVRGEAFHLVLRDSQQLDALSEIAFRFAAMANEVEMTKHHSQ
jgi:hypothetical protein